MVFSSYVFPIRDILQHNKKSLLQRARIHKQSDKSPKGSHKCIHKPVAILYHCPKEYTLQEHQTVLNNCGSSPDL